MFTVSIVVNYVFNVIWKVHAPVIDILRLNAKVNANKISLVKQIFILTIIINFDLICNFLVTNKKN